MDSPARERSVKQMIARVSGTIADWGRERGYFALGRGRRRVRGRADLHPAPPDGGVQLAGVVQRRLRGAAAVLGVPCPIDALVSTPDGMVPIGELVEGDAGRPRGLRRRRRHPHRGDEVQRREARLSRDAAQRPVGRGDRRTTSSRPSRERRTAPQWLRVDQLETGMRMHLHPHRAKVGQPVLVPAGGLDDEPAAPLEPTEDERVAIAEAALAGWLQADGFVGQYASGTNRSLTARVPGRQRRRARLGTRQPRCRLPGRAPPRTRRAVPGHEP